MNRRALLVGTSTLAASRALAQPMPIIGPVGSRQAGGGPLWSLNNSGPSLDLSFMTPGTLDPRLVFSRAATATYFDVTGTMQTAAVNAPRWDYNPSTLALRGLLIEEARSNIITHSSALSDFTLTSITQSGAGLVLPDGTTGGVRFTETTANSEHGVDFNFVGAANTVYTTSVYVKAGTITHAQIGLRGGTYWVGSNAVAVADLVAGTIAMSAGTGTPFIQSVGNGWYRIGVTATTAASPTGACYTRHGLALSAAVYSYVGVVTNTANFWGAQLEQGAFPTSYIPTVAATVTRSGELCTASLGAWNTPQVGTLAVEQLQMLLNGKSVCLVGICVPGGSKTAITVGAANTLIAFDIVGAVNQPLGAQPVGVPFKAAFGYRATFQQGALNAVLAASTSAAALTTGQTVLGIGCDGSAQQPNGYVRRVTYWPRVLSNTELQQVTT